MSILAFLLATVAPLSCPHSQDLIDNINKAGVSNKEELIEVVKQNTEPKCYEGSKHNS